MDISTPQRAYRLETFRSTGSISATASQQLRCYFITRCNFPSPPPVLEKGRRTDIKTVSDSAFLDRATKNTLDIYQEASSPLRLGPRSSIDSSFFRLCGMSKRGMGPSLRFSKSKEPVNGGWSLDTEWAAPPISSGDSCEGPGELLISQHNYSALSNLYHFYSLFSARKYVGQSCSFWPV